jgi:hypothetical protein
VLIGDDLPMTSAEWRAELNRPEGEWPLHHARGVVQPRWRESGDPA